MNAERAGDGGPVRQYEGEFEIHVTVERDPGESAEGSLRAWADRQGLKYTRIVLDRGRTPDQPMLTCQGRGTLPEQRARARQWVERLRGDGFRVTRVKIEAAPWNTGVPDTDVEAAALPDACYFEHHVKLSLSGTAEVTAVRALVVPLTAHVSRNARRRTSATGRHERFVTQRCRGVGRREAGRRLDTLLHALTEAGHTVVEVEREFVVHDDNPGADAGWIDGDGDGDGEGEGEDAGGDAGEGGRESEGGREGGAHGPDGGAPLRDDGDVGGGSSSRPEGLV